MAGLDLSAGMAAARGSMGGPGGMSFTIRMDPPAKEMELNFSRGARLIGDFKPVFNDVAKIFYKHEARSFASQGASTGEEWERLSKAYGAWKKQNFPGRPILQRRGALLAALTRRGAPGSLRRISNRGMVIGLNDKTKIGKYGKAHSTGTDNMPARPPVRFDPKVHTAGLKKVGQTMGADVPLGTAIAQMFQVYIVKARKKAKADETFEDSFDWRRMRRGVLRLKTR